MNYFVDKQFCLDDLTEFLSIPSVSTDVNYADAVNQCSLFVADKLTRIGLENVSFYNETKHPIVYAEKIIDAHLPTLLIYGHYDVQPADPIELWDSPPFQPEIRNEKIYARGASDDKAQVHLLMVAIDKIIGEGKLNCNIKVVFEGEEEIGSPGLYHFVAKNKKLLEADTLLVCDTAMPGLNQPALVNGLRGIVYFDLEVNGAPYDLHSGMNGGGVINPFNELCRVSGMIKDSENNLVLPGLHNACVTISDNETPANISDDIKQFGTGNFYEQTTLKTSFDIHGFYGGYTSVGAKTVISSKVGMKCSFRLSLLHDKEMLIELFTNFLKSNLHPSLSFNLKIYAECNAVEVSTNSSEFKLASECLEKHFNNKVLVNRIGGTIPVVSLFKDELNLSPILMGFGLEEDRIHSPNESFSLYNYFKGIDVLTDFISCYGNLKIQNENYFSASTLSKSLS